MSVAIFHGGRRRLKRNIFDDVAWDDVSPKEKRKVSILVPCLGTRGGIQEKEKENGNGWHVNRTSVRSVCIYYIILYYIFIKLKINYLLSMAK